MHICIAASYWPTSSNPISGIFIKHQLDAFIKMGHTVSLVLPGKDSSSYLGLDSYFNNPQFRVFYARHAILPLEPFPKLTLPNNLKLAGQSYIKQILAANRYQPIHAVLIHDITYPLGAVSLIKENLNIPVIPILHGEHPSITKAINEDSPCTAEYFQQSNKVVVVGNSLIPYAHLLGANQSNTVVIPNGAVDFEPIPADVHNLRILSNPKRVILTVCNLVENKGVDTVAHALNQIQERTDWTWRIIGDGDQRKTLEKLVRELNIHQRTQFFGRLTHEQTLTHMAAADIFVMPSHRESFGIVFVEAMKNSCPAIGCIGTGAEEIISPNSDGFLINPGDSQALAQRLKTWLSDVQQLADMSKNAKLTGQKFSWFTNARTFTNLINSEANNKSSLQ